MVAAFKVNYWNLNLHTELAEALIQNQNEPSVNFATVPVDRAGDDFTRIEEALQARQISWYIHAPSVQLITASNNLAIPDNQSEVKTICADNESTVQFNLIHLLRYSIPKFFGI
jgi:hypothetical protein